MKQPTDSFNSVRNLLTERSIVFICLHRKSIDQMEVITMPSPQWSDRRSFIGGSDARVIMGNDEAALIQLWREKRGEARPEDLSGKPHCAARERD
jgi:hypothetical protein